jgi:hypothetical protein
VKTHVNMENGNCETIKKKFTPEQRPVQRVFEEIFHIYGQSSRVRVLPLSVCKALRVRGNDFEGKTSGFCGNSEVSFSSC